jgi:biofilm PGA synthesis N-glycosyltransferase PgaC
MSWLKFEVLFAMAAYGLIVALVLLGKWNAKRKSDLCKSEKKTNSAKDISVIIPFRNEAGNLIEFIKSIQKLETLPLEFIFVNDHSDDESMNLLEQVDWNFPVKVIELEPKEFGKKEAIRKGVISSKGSFILTWDADVLPSFSYFSELQKFSWANLNILSVEMNGSNWISGFFAWDYQLQTQTSLSLAGWVRPITASGANLLFEKASFLETMEERKDMHLLSGDDQFLLSIFREKGKSIINLVSNNLTVITNSPTIIVEGMSQRSRWLGKSRAVNDNFANLFGLIVLMIQLSYYSFAFYQLSIGYYGATFLMVLIKGELDAFICTYKFQYQFKTIQVFVYELLFPVYIVVLLFHSLFFAATWKGRVSKKKITECFTE